MNDTMLDNYISSFSAKEINPVTANNAINELYTYNFNQTADEQRLAWHKLLYLIGKSEFLKSLKDDQTRLKAAETAFKIIRHSNYTLKDMFDQRAEAHPKHTLFRDMSSEIPMRFSYEQTANYTREIAAAFLSMTEMKPRTAIFTENSIDSACCDLACLFYDIPDTTINIHTDADVLVHIFNQLSINIVVCDNEQRFRLLQDIRSKTKCAFKIVMTDAAIGERNSNNILLGEACKSLSFKQRNELLAARTRLKLNEVCTVMFTSGSTGLPKGVSFSGYNLVTKRFARAAALPDVGKNEVLLCFLPLFHTFGRFFEMLGMIYWSGTYVFTGNPSSETLLSLFPLVNPTGFISIPLRWMQLHSKTMKAIENTEDHDEQIAQMRNICGTNLRWGLSAAGYLDPSIFRFFESRGINLCSGFGMTEATGGITMTPPGKYEDLTNGIPLPGINVKLSDRGELLMSGHYVAKYLEDAAIGDTIPYPVNEEDLFWIPTGDVFRQEESGYYRIVDRIKDIYKNNKGQTIAPQRVEMKFTDVPGIKRTFLVGDGRAYNVLFIVPDYNDRVFEEASGPEDYYKYFHQIVTQANKELAPYERVINFQALERDFDADAGELTAKGSYNRKTIMKNFSSLIKSMYMSNIVELEFDNVKIIIPRWFYRDQGILEDDILVSSYGLYNRSTGHSLQIMKSDEKNAYLVGDFIYFIEDGIIDMGLFTHQPKLWIGNPALIMFSHCKEGWARPMPKISAKMIPSKDSELLYEFRELPDLPHIRDQHLVALNRLISGTFFCDTDSAMFSISEIDKILEGADSRIANVVRRRLEALSYHSQERIRCYAYRILLLDEPDKSFNPDLEAFIKSGKSFINEESIEAIVNTKLEKRRLEALRQRLFLYKSHPELLTDKEVHKQFAKIFTILVNFVDLHPEFYSSVRAELAGWTLINCSKTLADTAEIFFNKLAAAYEKRLSMKKMESHIMNMPELFIFDDNISENEQSNILNILTDTTFLEQSVILAFDELNFDLSDIPCGGIWVSRMLTSGVNIIYKLSVNTKDNKHFDLLVNLFGNIRSEATLKTIYRMVAIAGYPYPPKILPRTGCCRPELNAVSLEYLSELTVWEKIREFSVTRKDDITDKDSNSWRKLFIEGMSAFFRCVKNSDRQIVPGAVNPSNVVVPELDYHEGATILSIGGNSEYQNAVSLIKPLVRNFYSKTIAHYPRSKFKLDINWIFDAAIEAYGSKEGIEFLINAGKEFRHTVLKCPDNNDMHNLITKYIDNFKTKYYPPLSVIKAIDRYAEQKRLNPMAKASAREEVVLELYRLYRLSDFSELTRYYFYKNTYFSDHSDSVIKAFDRLLDAMFRHQQFSAYNLTELSDLQAELTKDEDVRIFSRMVFPHFSKRRKIDIVKIGDSDRKNVVVHSYIRDILGINYTIRRPVKASEIGQLYRLFYILKHPMPVSTQHNYYMVSDDHERIIGGICYKETGKSEIHIDGAVIQKSLHGRNIESALIEDFCARMADRGIKVVKTHFLNRDIYLELGFKIDKSWGALVKFLR